MSSTCLLSLRLFVLGHCRPLRSRRARLAWAGPHLSLALLLLAVAAAAGCGTEASGSADASEDPGAEIGADVAPDVPAPTPSPTGSACSDDTPCSVNRCVTEFPGGYCSEWPCRGGFRCDGGGRCELVDEGRMCVQSCTSHAECREGYSCVPAESGETACLPTSLSSAAAPQPPEAEFQCYAIHRGRHLRVPIDPSQAVESQTLVFWVPLGRVDAVALELADGSSVPLSSEIGREYTVGYRSLRSLVVLTVPAYPGAAYEDVRGAIVTADLSDQICVRQVLRDRQGDTLRLNAYINAAVPDATELPGSYVRMFNYLAVFFGRYGIDVEYNVAFLPPDAAAEWSVIRSYNDLDRLAASAPAGDTRPDAEINIFFVAGIALPNSSVIGISQGIPGPPGMHGTAAAGVIVDASYLRSGTTTREASFVADVVAHELGHFMGLYHTSEISRTQHDPLADTDECGLTASGTAGPCSMQSNLMWPQASDVTHWLSSDQVWVLRRHPAVITDAD